MTNRYLKFYPNNFMRAVSLGVFDERVVKTFNPKIPIRVALIGGTHNEPELLWLSGQGFSLEVTIFGIEEYDVFLDLNISQTELIQDSYDLILCSQVWEHIWNHHAAFRSIRSLMSPETLLWMTSPAINRFHGSPEYYSAGFSVHYFAKNLREHGLEFTYGETLGSKRYFRSISLLPMWLTVRSHRFPLLVAWQAKSPIRRLMAFFYLLAEVILLHFSSGAVTSNPKYGCETLVFARMPRAVQPLE